MARESESLATYKFLRESNEKLIERRNQSIAEAENRRKEFLKGYNSILESAEVKRRRHGKLIEMCRNDALGTAIKGIFIGALEAHTLTDRGLLLAETMVDNYIKENGGANKILGECKNKTYLLNRIAEIVEEAALLEAEEIEDIDKDKDIESTDNTEEKKDNVSDEEVEKAMDTIKDKLGDDEEAQKALKVIQTKVDVESEEEEKEEEPKSTEGEDKETEDETLDSDDLDVEDDIGMDSSEDSGSGEEDNGDDSNTGSSDSAEFSDGGEKEESGDTEDGESEEETPEDGEEEPEEDDDDGEEKLDDDINSDNETEVADDITDDIESPDEDLSIDGEPESKGKILDDLEKEEDVKKAVDLIRQRVADAEENFIKRNAEDKKQVEELIGRISDNVKTVEDIADEDDPESKVAEESARLYKRAINNISTKRPLTVLEKMTRYLHANILKDQMLKETYMTEENTIDTGLIVESAKVMYGFLETLNTLQLEKVDKVYIEKVLGEMK